jgi:hypothetical protein
MRRREFIAIVGTAASAIALRSRAALAEPVRRVGVIIGFAEDDLPVQLPTKYQLVINIKTANALGLNVPNSIQLLADGMIE